MTGSELRFGASSGRDAKGGTQTPAFRLPRPRALLLFVLPSPLVLASLIALGAGRFGDMLADAAAFGLCMLGAVLTRRGIQRAFAPQPRRAASNKAPVSLKNLGAGAVAAGTGVAAYFGVGHGPAISLAFSGIALIAFHLLYGLDPLRPPWRRESMRRADDALAATLEEAESRILSIERAAGRIRNTELRLRLGRIATQGRDILGMIERRPGELRRARKFLTVYLEGTERVTQGYAATHRVAESSELEQSFRSVLTTVEEVFGEQQKRLLETDLMDLDVQIEVLNRQLKREGIP
jgi:hypothetical protein